MSLRGCAVTDDGESETGGALPHCRRVNQSCLGQTHLKFIVEFRKGSNPVRPPQIQIIL